MSERKCCQNQYLAADRQFALLPQYIQRSRLYFVEIKYIFSYENEHQLLFKPTKGKFHVSCTETGVHKPQLYLFLYSPTLSFENEVSD